MVEGLKVRLTLKKSFSFFPSPALNRKKKKKNFKNPFKEKITHLVKKKKIKSTFKGQKA
jgi:hypothetical protein